MTGKNRHRNKKKGGQASNTRTYFKVYATFKCSSDKCNKTWNSAHAWEREELIACEFCQTKAEVLNVVDEMIKLDNYRCPVKNCENYWQSIHDGQNLEQECDLCEVKVRPDGAQERFGRHYFYTCPNQTCAQCPEWEDFSIEPQKTQRCTKCSYRGDIIKVQKLKPVPRWVRDRQKEQLAKEGKSVGINLGGGKGKHNAEFCDMCQHIIREGKGRNCFNVRKIVCVLGKTADGVETEHIVSASREQ
ncbi:hypothetical protein Ocin01_16497 [Orchesella cincta]|uniref:Uncharacterized protein n=1 Tax=Orchesella cincta TaxID=48709 RepID=A0A1D2MB93_ORCCI|nr:hypothetical protein Ocin01_16497 [Orchesella cincta]